MANHRRANPGSATYRTPPQQYSFGTPGQATAAMNTYLRTAPADRGGLGASFGGQGLSSDESWAKLFPNGPSAARVASGQDNFGPSTGPLGASQGGTGLMSDVSWAKMFPNSQTANRLRGQQPPDAATLTAQQDQFDADGNLVFPGNSGGSGNSSGSGNSGKPAGSGSSGAGAGQFGDADALTAQQDQFDAQGNLTFPGNSGGSGGSNGSGSSGGGGDAGAAPPSVAAPQAAVTTSTGGGGGGDPVPVSPAGPPQGQSAPVQSDDGPSSMADGYLPWAPQPFAPMSLPSPQLPPPQLPSMPSPQLPSMSSMSLAPRPMPSLPNLADGWTASETTPSWGDEAWKSNMQAGMEAAKNDNASAANEERGNLKAAGFGNENVTTPQVGTQVLDESNGGHIVVPGNDPGEAQTFSPGNSGWQQAATNGQSAQPGWSQSGGGASSSPPLNGSQPMRGAGTKNYALGRVPGIRNSERGMRNGPGGRAVPGGGSRRGIPAALAGGPNGRAGMNLQGGQAMRRGQPMPTGRVVQGGQPMRSVRSDAGTAAAFARERAAIQAHRGGARPGDRPVLANLAGLGPAVINTGEKVVRTPYGDAVLNRQMQRQRKCYSFR